VFARIATSKIPTEGIHMSTIEALLERAGFQREGQQYGSRMKFHKPGTAYKAAVGERTFSLLRVVGRGIDGIRPVATVDTRDLGAVEGALQKALGA
jgi:hypothetical protein